MNSLAVSICACGAGHMICPSSVLNDGVAWYSGNCVVRRFLTCEEVLEPGALLFMGAGVGVFALLAGSLTAAALNGRHCTRLRGWSLIGRKHAF